ncbi:sporulation protein, partial [Veillonellaceae bacterium M1-70]|nr:sporulation protein [Veillonellaceae bacterium M1-70]
KLIAMAPEIIEKLKKDKYIYINDDDKTSATDEDDE